MSLMPRWTTADLELFPDDGLRREIIDGELYVSTQPHYHHQYVSNRVAYILTAWSDERDAGKVAPAPGIIFDRENAVAPDVVWISQQRLAGAVGEDGKYHAAPDLVVEVLSYGSRNEERDTEIKLKLYSQRGVLEYWIMDWRGRKMEVYRRKDAVLQLVATLFETDTLTSPHLPGFSVAVAAFFRDIPQ